MYFNFFYFFFTLVEADATMHVNNSETLHVNESGTSGLQMSSCMASASSSALPDQLLIPSCMDPSLAAPRNPPTATSSHYPSASTHNLLASTHNLSASPHNPSTSTTPTSPPSKVRKGTRGRFAEEYATYRRKQDEYYDLLIKQTKIEHMEQLKVYQLQQEAARSQCQVYEAIKNRICETCSHVERLASECQTNFKKQ